MEKIKQYKVIIIIGLVIIGFGFYWFQIRPSQIRIECGEKRYDGSLSYREAQYITCLRSNGLDR